VKSDPHARTSSQGETLTTQRFHRSAANAAWAAPIVAILFSFCSASAVRRLELSSGGHEPVAKLILGLIAVAIVMIGSASGIVALCGVRAHGHKEITLPAVLGLALNALLIMFGVSVYRSAPSASASRAPAASMLGRPQAIAQRQATTDQEGLESMLHFPGWIGLGRTSFGSVAAASLDDRSPTARRILNELAVRCSIIAIAVNNSAGTQALDVNPSSLQLHMADGSVVRALNADRTLASVKSSGTSDLGRFAGTQHVPAGQALYELACFIPAGVDATAIKSATIHVNGRPISFSGRYLSVKEKSGLDPNRSGTANASASAG
jgi:hypothetical protein